MADEGKAKAMFRQQSKARIAEVIDVCMPMSCAATALASRPRITPSLFYVSRLIVSSVQLEVAFKHAIKENKFQDALRFARTGWCRQVAFCMQQMCMHAHGEQACVSPHERMRANHSSSACQHVVLGQL
eukprot:365747-Chlamydomonas_euryale.AAC.43